MLANTVRTTPFEVVTAGEPPAQDQGATGERPPAGQSPATSGSSVRAAGTPVLALRVANTGGQGARVRAEPSRQADSIAVLPDATVVQALGPAREADDESWRRVRAEDGVEGWVASELLAPASAAGD